MAKYKVIGAKREYQEGGETKVTFDPIKTISQAGMAKGKEFGWDPGAEITELQVSDDQAKTLVEAGQLEVIEAPASWVKPQE